MQYPAVPCSPHLQYPQYPFLAVPTVPTVPCSTHGYCRSTQLSRLAPAVPTVPTVPCSTRGYCKYCAVPTVPTVPCSTQWQYPQYRDYRSTHGYCAVPARVTEKSVFGGSKASRGKRITASTSLSKGYSHFSFQALREGKQ